MLKNKVFAGCLVGILLLIAIVAALHGNNFEVLNPKGIIANRERNLIVATVLLSLIVVLPVFALTATIAWKYRATNTKAKYTPDWDHHFGAEVAWWTIPSAIILVLSVITWNSAHSLDPYKPLAARGVVPINIQVVALNWKWLFIYPDQKVASVNMLEMPVNTPVNFKITADAPMNSFWIPQLGGQIYAMPSMITQLNLMASQNGDYHGSSANISGAGFAGMDFTARATSSEAFDKWVASTSKSKLKLDKNSYDQLSKDSQNNPVTYYALTDKQVFSQVLDKYMSPNDSMNMSHMDMSGMTP